ncbi:MAG: HypC/HybG/HupF family hydrogenase formation chaperone [Candidatus Portnoybacteria bacterium]|nr:HypC/HybG/HupF family hydrogenase formation chaperone [Candidatus Portnoybacteria bacterium]
MCLTIPKQVVSFRKGRVLLASPSGEEEAGSLIRIKKGDWVLTQNQIVVSKITKKQAKDILGLWRGKK